MGKTYPSLYKYHSDEEFTEELSLNLLNIFRQVMKAQKDNGK